MNVELSIEQVLHANGTPVYAVFPCPEWAHYDAENCPLPIRDWIEQHYPDVAIVRLSGFSCDYLGPIGIKNPNGLLSELLPCPVFLLGFNDQQATHFSKDWSKPGLPNDFYFVTCERQWTVLDDENSDYYTQINPNGAGEPTNSDGRQSTINRARARISSLANALGTILRRALSKQPSQA